MKLGAQHSVRSSHICCTQGVSQLSYVPDTQLEALISAVAASITAQGNHGNVHDNGY